MAKSDKVKSSFTGVGDIRPSPVEKTGKGIEFSSGTGKLSASPLSASYDSRPQINDNQPGKHTIDTGGKLGAVDAGRKSHKFGNAGRSDNDRY